MEHDTSTVMYLVNRDGFLGRTDALELATARDAAISRAERAEAALERVRETLVSRRCGDHGCVYGHGGGMGTNGGCHVDKLSEREWLRELREFARDVRAVLEGGE